MSALILVLGLGLVGLLFLFLGVCLLHFGFPTVQEEQKHAWLASLSKDERTAWLAVSRLHEQRKREWLLLRRKQYILHKKIAIEEIRNGTGNGDWAWYSAGIRVGIDQYADVENAPDCPRDHWFAKLYDPARFSIVIQNMQYARRKPPKPAGLYP